MISSRGRRNRNSVARETDCFPSFRTGCPVVIPYGCNGFPILRLVVVRTGVGADIIRQFHRICGASYKQSPKDFLNCSLLLANC